jgi:hypothetical protein
LRSSGALRGPLEEPYDPFDRFFHAIEAGEGWIGAYGPVQQDTAKAGILAVSIIGGSPIAARSRSAALAYRIESPRRDSRYSTIDISVSLLALVGPGESVELRIVVHDLTS